jgi:uncharacterized protein (DUF2126 family)/transglutaminase-like putative cysteine protease
MQVSPEQHFCNWQQDPQGNYLARLVFPKKTRHLSIEVDLVADITAINPFDFFLEPYAESFPFRYEDWLLKELAPFLQTLHGMPLLQEWVASVDRTAEPTIQAITALNQRVHSEIRYEIRMEPGVQTPEETLTRASGSCRDSAWLLVQIFRHLGVAARFASGYLIQVAPDVKPIDGPAGPDEDFTDLHAWAEIYLPGAGWVGLDPTSGLLCGEGHLPLACTPDPSSASPITGTVDQAECEFSFSMSVQRIHEDPRSTKPYTDEQWERVDQLGRCIDQQLRADDARLTFGGEPTFVSMDDMQSEEWNQAAVGPTKRQISGPLIKRLRQRFGPGGLLHYGQGKWYPGESLPRWALTCLWRVDGEPIWHDDRWIADESRDYGFTFTHARAFTEKLAGLLGVDSRWMMPAYEDLYYYMWREQRLPLNVQPWDPKLEDPEERARIARVFQRGLHHPVGVVLPIRCQWWQGSRKWESGPWPIRPEKLFLLPGDSSIGLRLPLDTLPYSSAAGAGTITPLDPFASRPPLPSSAAIVQQLEGIAKSLAQFAREKPGEKPRGKPGEKQGASVELSHEQDASDHARGMLDPSIDTEGLVRTALCVEPRDGRIYIFMPPTELLEDYLELTAAIEAVAKELGTPVVVEGYLPPRDHRIQMIKVTPDPGVIEVNVHPSRTWTELVATTQGLYEDARYCRLATEKFDLDGKHTGTGGGNHIVMGGPTPWDSPFLRRPDLLRSMIAFWNNHPSLSYFFSNRFVGPTSQAPRADEGRSDALYELQTALELIPDRDQELAPWVVDRLLRNLLIDLTGNTHRAEICIDKLYSPDSSTGRLGLVELRGFEMPPHAQMSLVTQLLVRCLIANFWRTPYREPLVTWGTALHDRFMLPHYLLRDLRAVLLHLQEDGWDWEESWFAPHFEFRFPFIGRVEYSGASICLRSAIEPWYVLGEEPGGGGTVRYVDSSVERMEVKVQGIDMDRLKIVCNQRILPLQPTGEPDTYIAGVRYRAWWPPSCLHPTVPLHTPLVFDLWDSRAGRTLGGCTYHVAHPGGRNYETFPINALEAEGRRIARFFPYGHTPGKMSPKIPRENSTMPTTLDLRRERLE